MGEEYSLSTQYQPNYNRPIHNPADVAQEYAFTLDREFGLSLDSGSFLLSSPIARCVEGRYRHVLMDDGTLIIEGKYKAKRD